MFFHVPSFNVTEHTAAELNCKYFYYFINFQLHEPWMYTNHFGFFPTFGWETKDNLGYSRNSLLNPWCLETDLMNNRWNIPAELLSQTPNNKQGDTHRRGQTQKRDRDKHWSLSSVILNKCPLLRNHRDELQSNVSYMPEYRNTSILHGVQWNMALQAHRWLCRMILFDGFGIPLRLWDKVLINWDGVCLYISSIAIIHESLWNTDRAPGCHFILFIHQENFPSLSIHPSIFYRLSGSGSRG